MKYQKLLITLAFAVALGAEVRAATVTISQTQAYSNLTTGTRTLSFNLLNTASGSSVAISDIVSISITGFINKSAGSWSVTNLEEEDVNVDIDQTTKSWFTSAKSIGFLGTDVSPNLFSDFSDTVTISSFGIATGNFGTAETGSLGGSLASSFFSEYLGAGTFNVVVNALQSTSVDGPGIDQSTNSPRLNGNVVVTYVLVPEPSAASLLIFGLGGLAAIRCVRRKS
jgi:hypothetical protein